MSRYEDKKADLLMTLKTLREEVDREMVNVADDSFGSSNGIANLSERVTKLSGFLRGYVAAMNDAKQVF